MDALDLKRRYRWNRKTFLKSTATRRNLSELARAASDKAYAPFSHFKVGAALLTKGGKVYTGVNIENSSFGATICAERTAFVKAISEGERKFEAIAIYAVRQ